MQETSFPVRETTSETAPRPAKLPKWTLPLFIVAMTFKMFLSLYSLHWGRSKQGERG